MINSIRCRCQVAIKAQIMYIVFIIFRLKWSRFISAFVNNKISCHFNVFFFLYAWNPNILNIRDKLQSDLLLYLHTIFQLQFIYYHFNFWSVENFSQFMQWMPLNDLEIFLLFIRIRHFSPIWMVNLRNWFNLLIGTCLKWITAWMFLRSFGPKPFSIIHCNLDTNISESFQHFACYLFNKSLKKYFHGHWYETTLIGFTLIFRMNYNCRVIVSEEKSHCIFRESENNNEIRTGMKKNWIRIVQF